MQFVNFRSGLNVEIWALHNNTCQIRHSGRILRAELNSEAKLDAL